MRIIGVEGVHHFPANGDAGGSSSNMLVELPGGEQYRVPIDQETYMMLSELAKISALQAGHAPQPDLAEYQQPTAPATKQRLDRTAQPGQIPQSLEDFAKGFVTGPNMGAPPVPPQNDLVGQLSSMSDSELNELAELAQPQEGNPLDQLRKIGMFGEPTDVMASLGTTSNPQGPDVIESFEDTSDDDDEDPGEEYDDDGEIASQF